MFLLHERFPFISTYIYINFNLFLMEGYKVINLKDVRDSPHKRLSLEPIPEPLDEDDPRPIRSQERLKRHFMRASKFDMQDFFESRYDEAKL